MGIHHKHTQLDKALIKTCLSALGKHNEEWRRRRGGVCIWDRHSRFGSDCNSCICKYNALQRKLGLKISMDITLKKLNCLPSSPTRALLHELVGTIRGLLFGSDIPVFCLWARQTVWRITLLNIRSTITLADLTTTVTAMSPSSWPCLAREAQLLGPHGHKKDSFDTLQSSAHTKVTDKMRDDVFLSVLFWNLSHIVDLNKWPKIIFYYLVFQLSLLK